MGAFLFGRGGNALSRSQRYVATSSAAFQHCGTYANPRVFIKLLVTRPFGFFGPEIPKSQTRKSEASQQRVKKAHVN